MSIYVELAEDLISSMDMHKGRPPHEEVSANMRGEMAVMRFLMLNNRPASSGELSRALDMATSRVAAVLNSLEKKAQIRRQTDSADKRRVLVTLTDNGRAICLGRRREALDHMSALLERLGEKDAREFVRLMKRAREESEKIPKPGFEAKED